MSQNSHTRDGFSGGFKTLNYSFFLKKNVCPIVFQCAQWEKCDAQNVAFQMLCYEHCDKYTCSSFKVNLWTGRQGKLGLKVNAR